MGDHEVCHQERTIGKIEATLGSIKEELEKHGEREDRMITALEVVAAQGESLKSLVARQDKTEQDVDELFERERKDPLAIKIWKSSAGIYILGLIFIGTVLDVYYHFGAIKLIISLLK